MLKNEPQEVNLSQKSGSACKTGLTRRPPLAEDKGRNDGDWSERGKHRERSLVKIVKGHDHQKGSSLQGKGRGA